MLSRAIVGCAVVVLVVAPAAAQGPITRLVPSRADLTIPYSLDGKRFPVWSGDSLVVEESAVGAAAPSIVVFDRRGGRVLNANLSIAEAAHTYVEGYARGADGAVAACGSSYASDGRVGRFIAWISADGRSQKVIRTNPYWPFLIAFSPDGTLWTVGYEMDSEGAEKGVDVNAGVLRHFERSGDFLGAFLPRSAFKDPRELGEHNGYLFASRKGIGWLHWRGNGEGAYVQVFPGGEITSHPIPQLPSMRTRLLVRGAALTDSGDLYLCMREGGGPRDSLFRFEGSTGLWSAISISAPEDAERLAAPYLFGASGSDLVLQLPGREHGRFRFFAPAP